MTREYHKWYSANLEREMEFLVFGHSGTPVLFFPPRTGRFYDYENWKIIQSISDKIDSGQLRIVCLDSIDSESFYSPTTTPDKKILRHMQYEAYLLEELIPFVQKMAPNTKFVSAGCSLGAYHAVNFAFKHPEFFYKIVGMSGRYDLTVASGFYQDLFQGYWDENVYFNMPGQYIKNLYVESILKQLRELEIILIVGVDDLLCESSKYLSQLLNEKGVHNQLYLWEEEAHKPYYWRKMMQLYF